MPQNLPKPGAPKRSGSNEINGNPLKNNLFLIGAMEDDEDNPEEKGPKVEPDWTCAIYAVIITIVALLITVVVALITKHFGGS